MVRLTVWVADHRRVSALESWRTGGEATDDGSVCSAAFFGQFETSASGYGTQVSVRATGEVVEVVAVGSGAPCVGPVVVGDGSTPGVGAVAVEFNKSSAGSRRCGTEGLRGWCDVSVRGRAVGDGSWLASSGVQS